MARETRRMALYEAIRKGQSKRRGRQKTVRLRPFVSARRGGAAKNRNTGLYHRLEAGADSGGERWAALWSRRVNLSLSYPVAGCLIAAAVVLLVAAVRFGQVNYDTEWLLFDPVAAREPVAGDTVDIVDIEQLMSSTVIDDTRQEDVTAVTDNETVPEDKAEDRTEETKVNVPQGTNAIVIQAYKQRRDLEPVKRHFEAHGIETEIVQRGSFFCLRTKQLYHKCSVNRNGFNPDYDGDVAMRQIRKIGAMYKAPPGYESFRPNLFQDAYAEKVR